VAREAKTQRNSSSRPSSTSFFFLAFASLWCESSHFAFTFVFCAQIAISLDQADIEDQLDSKSFQAARDIYEKGAHALSVATINLDAPSLSLARARRLRAQRHPVLP